MSDQLSTSVPIPDSQDGSAAVVTPLAVVATPVATVVDDADQPSESWDVERLGKYAAKQLGVSDADVKRIAILQKRSVTSYFYAGQALFYVNKKLKGSKRGGWVTWLKDHKIARTTAHDAMSVYRWGQTVEKVAEYKTVSELVYRTYQGARKERERG